MKIRQTLSKNYYLIALGVVLAIILLVTIFAYAQKQNNTNQTYKNQNSSHKKDRKGQNNNKQNKDSKDNEHSKTPLPTSTDISSQAKDAIYKALDDEYKSQATYQTVINKLGSVRPFKSIIKAEQKHINSLVTLLNNYNLSVPANPYSNIEAKDTLAQNCQIGVQTETDNANLYKNQLLPVVTSYPDISATFTNLMNASQQKHLPAFSNCAS